MAHANEPRPRQARHRNLVLIGYRATGKTSVGARLARGAGTALLWTWTRCWSGRPAGPSPTSWPRAAGASSGGWKRRWWPAYRHTRGQVLATGGGVVLDPDNVAALRENGILIWLTADPAAIQARLAAGSAPGRQSPQPDRGGHRPGGRGGAARALSPLSGCGPDECGYHAPLRLPGSETGARGLKI